MTTTIIKEVCSFLFLAAPTIVEAVVDFIETRKTRKPDNHKKDLIPRLFAMIVVAAFATIISPEREWWRGIIFSFGIFVLFFDDLIGFLLTKRLGFLGTSSQTDGFWNRIGRFKTYFIKGTLFVGSVITYYKIFW